MNEYFKTFLKGLLTILLFMLGHVTLKADYKTIGNVKPYKTDTRYTVIR